MYDRTKEALMMKAILAFAQGCGGAEVSEEACQWFYGRYSTWIGSLHKVENVIPMDIWDQHGKDFIGKFKEIGQRVAALQSGVIELEALKGSALDVERESTCPYCPIKGE